MTENVSDTLNKAAYLIEERGWSTGDGWQFYDTQEGSPVCLEGGIMAAIGLRFDPDDCGDLKFAPLFACPAYIAVCNYLDREVPTAKDTGFTGAPLYHWNDEQLEAAPVVGVLRATALIESARERKAAEARP